MLSDHATWQCSECKEIRGASKKNPDLPEDGCEESEDGKHTWWTPS